MTPRQVVQLWVDTFNKKDPQALANLYHEDAINYQVNTDPVIGKQALLDMFTREFALAEMVCLVENIFEDGEWAILEWKDPNSLQGCGFFQVQNDKIVFQRGYWDKLSFLRLHGLPLPTE